MGSDPTGAYSHTRAYFAYPFEDFKATRIELQRPAVSFKMLDPPPGWSTRQEADMNSLGLVVAGAVYVSLIVAITRVGTKLISRFVPSFLEEVVYGLSLVGTAAQYVEWAQAGGSAPDIAMEMVASRSSLRLPWREPVADSDVDGYEGQVSLSTRLSCRVCKGAGVQTQQYGNMGS